MLLCNRYMYTGFVCNLYRALTTTLCAHTYNAIQPINVIIFILVSSFRLKWTVHTHTILCIQVSENSNSNSLAFSFSMWLCVWVWVWFNMLFLFRPMCLAHSNLQTHTHARRMYLPEKVIHQSEQTNAHTLLLDNVNWTVILEIEVRIASKWASHDENKQ